MINVSLDGFADHTVAIADDELHEYVAGYIETADTAIFGRTTYEMMASSWPHAPQDPNATPGEIRFARRFNEMPKIVYSQTLQKAEWNNTKLVRENAVEDVARLKQQAGGVISIGGLRLSSALLKAGLIDEFRILVHPVIVRSGTRLFSGAGVQEKLKLTDVRTLHSGVSVLRYTRGARPTSGKE